MHYWRWGAGHLEQAHLYTEAVSAQSSPMQDPQNGERHEQGCITVDGVDIRDVTLTSLRQFIAVVFQEVGLFNRSIYENTHIGRLDATPKEVEAAARMAEAHDVIMVKPGGYNFVIGERGSALSGGERQRIGIARAILKNAPILILDEATSALDNQTEARVQRAFDAVRAERTTFIIAHRLSTIANADRILVFRNGRIVEAGRYEELLGQGGIFADLVRIGTSPPSPAGLVRWSASRRGGRNGFVSIAGNTNEECL